MSRLDRFYRAFGEYRKSIAQEREISALRAAVAEADRQDRIRAIRSSCTIENDWVEEIERGLVFIEKAINEERQFIRSEGEVAPIEKIKHVSRESVEHLARHSNLLTQESKDGDLMPEKLYTVERLNNYAVYENRFLYMVLLHLADFVSVRYDRIVKLTNTYRGESLMQKKVTYGKATLEYEINLKEVREDDPYLREHNGQREKLERLERIQRSIYYYLHTPLMIEVAKADKLKPPVTKTNVLRMDKNFKEVVALYDYISAYDRDGFSVEEEERQVNCSKKELAEQFTDPVLLLSFLTYEHGLGIEEELKEAFKQEELRRREEERRLLQEELENMRRRIAEGGGSPEEYIRLLERYNRELEKEKAQLLLIKEKAEQTEQENRSLKETIVRYQAEIEALEKQHAKEKDELKANCEELSRQMAEEAAAHSEEILRINCEKEEEIARSRSECEDIVRKNMELLAQKEREREELQLKAERLDRERAFAASRLTALRAEHGLIGETEDYSSEAAFQELEHQYEVLGSFLHREWKGAKRALRLQFLSDVKALFTQNWGKDLIPFGKKQDRATEATSAETDEKTRAREGADREKDAAEEERAENAPAEEEPAEEVGAEKDRTDSDAERGDREGDGNEVSEAK